MEGIRLYSYRQGGKVLSRLYGEKAAAAEGVSFSYDGQDYIFYNDEMLPERQRYTIAHEIGHCVMEHFSLYESGEEYDPEVLERQAEKFAIQLLAPACVLWGVQARRWNQVARLCGISRQAAERRLERLARLEQDEKRGIRRFLVHPMEVMVYHQFADFVRNQVSEGVDSL